MRTAKRTAAFLFLVILFPGLSHSYYMPGTNVEVCAWTATEIVVASADLKGHFAIQEVITGNLRAGETIFLPEFEGYFLKIDRKIYDGEDCKPSDKSPDMSVCTILPAPKDGYITGKRVYLFLSRDRDGALSLPKGNEHWGRDVPEPFSNYFGFYPSWPVAVGQARTSLVWIENGQVLASRGGSSFELIPGRPGSIAPLGRSEQSLRENIDSIITSKAELSRILALRDVKEKARLLAPLAKSAMYMQSRAALAGLSTLGDAGAEVLIDLLTKEDKGSRFRYELIGAIARTNSTKKSPDLLKLLYDQIADWSALAEKIENKEQVPGEKLSQQETILLIAAAGSLGYAEVKAAGKKVEALRNIIPKLSPHLKYPEQLDRVCRMFLGLPMTDDDGILILSD